jgi:hypothetical protein
MIPFCGFDRAFGNKGAPGHIVDVDSGAVVDLGEVTGADSESKNDKGVKFNPDTGRVYSIIETKQAEAGKYNGGER